jgi:hypothetical protein
MRRAIAFALLLGISLGLASSRAQDRDARGAPRFEHVQWRSDVAFAWSGGEGKEAKKLHVSRAGGPWREWGPETVPSYIEDVTSKEAALELAVHFYPGWGELVTAEQWKKTEELCARLGIPSVDAPRGLMWIAKQPPKSFETKVVPSKAGFDVTYVAWRWREIATYDVHVGRDGRTTLGKRELHMLVDYPETAQTMANAPHSDEERLSMRFIDEIKKIFQGGWHPTHR